MNKCCARKRAKDESMKRKLCRIVCLIVLATFVALLASACGEDVKLVSISVDGSTLKNVYTQGDQLDLEGAGLILSYSDGTTESVELTRGMIANNFDSAAVGTHSLVINYEDQSCRFSYSVQARPVESNVAAASLQDECATYRIGDAFAYQGTLNATFNDGTEASWPLANIKSVMTISGFKTDKAGTYTCLLHYDSPYGAIEVDYTYSVEPLAQIESAAYQYTQPIKAFVGDTRAEFAAHLAQYPFVLTYADGTTAEIFVNTANAIDRTFAAETAGDNYTVAVTVSDSHGRSTRVNVQYSVVERHEVYTVTFDPNYGGISPIEEHTDAETGKIAQQNFSRKGYICRGWYVDTEDGERFDFGAEVTRDLYLVAKWQIQDYYIKITSFGTAYGSTRYFTINDTITLEPPLAPAEGYEFLYYSYNGTPIEHETILPGTFAENLELVAVWRAITYDLTYDLHDSAAYPVQNKEDFAAATYTTQDSRLLPTPLRAGYVFMGWSTDQAGRNVIDTLSGLVGDLTLHANWSAETYYITFVQASNGNVIGNRKSFSINSTDTVIEPAQLTGYRFEGWYLDQQCTRAFYSQNGQYVLKRGAYTADFTLYAKTTIVYSLRLAGGKTDVLTFAIGEDEDEAYLAAWRAASKGTNCDLDYWYYAGDDELPALSLYVLDDEGNEHISLSTQALAAYDGKTLSAVWKGRTRNITYYYGYDDVVEYDTYDTYLGATLPTPTRGGYRFAGWRRNAALTGEVYTEIKSCQYDVNLFFYAKWIAVPYTLTFHYMIDEALLTTRLNGLTAVNGTVYTLDYTVESDDFAFAPMPQAKYNTFGGWFPTTEYRPETRMGSLPQGTYDVTDLYCKWTPTVYGVRFLSAGGGDFVGALAADQTTDVSYYSDDVLLYTPTRPGYTFEGWYVDKNCTTPVATNDAGQYWLDLSALFAQAGDALLPDTGEKQYLTTVYAKWSAISYTATFVTVKVNNTTVQVLDNPNATEGDTAAFSAEAPLTLLAPTANGYIFEGWYLDAAYTEAIASTANIYRNINVYPKWEKGEYTITYADFSEDEIDALKLPTTYTLGGALNTTAKFTSALANKMKRYGYTLGGVYTDPDLDEAYRVTSLGNANVASGAPYCANVVLYGKWSAITYTITLKYKTSATASTNYAAAEWNGAYSKQLTVEDLGADGLAMPIMTMKGYATQTEWYTDVACTKQVTEDGKLTLAKMAANISSTNQTLYCPYAEQKYDVYYTVDVSMMAEDTEIELPQAAQYTYFANFTLPTVAIPDQYADTLRWIGWYLEPTYETQIATIAKNTYAEALHLYGRIEQIHTITYDAQGATISGGVDNFAKGETITLPTPTISDRTKSFSGYYLEGYGNIGTTLPDIDQDVVLTPLFYNSTTKNIVVEYAEDKASGIVKTYLGTTACTLPTLMGTAAMFTSNTAVPVLAIGERAFADKTLSSVTVPAGYQIVGAGAFAGSRLTTITLPNTVTSIGRRAFGSCTALKTATINGGSIGGSSYLFSGCTALTTATINGASIAADSRIFDGCTALATVTINTDEVGSEVLVGAAALSTLYVTGAVTLTAMFETTSGNVRYPATFAALHITGATLSSDFDNNINKLSTVTSVYLDSATMVDISSASMSIFLSTRTIYVPTALLSAYREAYPDWTFERK